jgi:hypothetical protein
MTDEEQPISLSRPSSVHLWCCSHPLCERAVQDIDVDYYRFMGRHTDNPARIAKAGAVLLSKQEGDPPKCVGGASSKGGYRSHRAAPMELVEFAPVDA